jgi:subtilase family serine protease
MARPHNRRNKKPNRLNLAAYLERLEERQLLSASAIAAPVMQTAGLTFEPIGRIGQPLQPTATVANTIYSPAQIEKAYGANLIANGGKGTTVAIVDAYKDPDITNDLSIFSTEFGLPQMTGGSLPTFSILTPTGQPTPRNAPHDNWAVEESLDVEYVHAIAPYANIDLIEASSPTTDYLFGAEVDGQTYKSGVGYAKSLTGVDVITNSYGGSEFSGETTYNAAFNEPASHNPVAIVYSTGDSAAPGAFPAFAPDVIAAGGTSLYTLTSSGIYGSESGWADGGGGVSKYESTPSYQSSNGVNFGARSIPDVSMDANPDTGVLVIDQYDYPGEYIGVGGTSLAAPMTGAVIALGDQARITGGGTSMSTTGVLTAYYGAYNSANYSTDFHDITTGNNGFAAGPGYDLVTGIGSPKIQNIVPLLASATDPGPLVQIASTPEGTGNVTPPPIKSFGSTTVTPGTGESLVAPAVGTVTSSVGLSGTALSDQVSEGSETTALPASGQGAATGTITLMTSLDNRLATTDSVHATLDTNVSTADFASESINVGADAAATLDVAPSDSAASDMVPTALGTSVADSVFADVTSESIFDRIADAPAAVVSSTDDSHAADIAMLAAAALAIYGYRSKFARSEEKVHMLPVT